VQLSAPLGKPGLVRQLEELGGDLRLVTARGEPQVELRWCRDGRPDITTPVLGPDADWPPSEKFAIDLHGARLGADGFARLLDGAARCQSRGGRVHFLNMPEAMQSWAISQGRAHDMPMREKVGPRLPAVLADLWSEP